MLENLTRLLDATDDLFIYDNSSAEDPYKILAVLVDGTLKILADPLPGWLAPVPLADRRTVDTVVIQVG